MNNDYDRDGSSEIVFDDMKPDGNVKLVLFTNGDLVLCRYREVMGESNVIIDDPKVVVSRSTACPDTGKVTTTITYHDWMALSSDRTFSVNSSTISTVTTPIQSLYDSYAGGELDG